MHRAENLLLRSIDYDDAGMESDLFDITSISIGYELAKAGDRLDHVYFPSTGIFASLAPVAGHQRLAVEIVGREGCIGCAAVLGGERWTHDVVAHNADRAVARIAVTVLQDLCRSNPKLHARLLAFAVIAMMQVSSAVVSTVTHPVKRRIARWLLLNHDRLDGDEIHATHDEMAVMLGVRRASATDIMHILEGEGLVRNRRGVIVIRDRAGLERLTGGAYGPAEAEYRRLIGPFGKSAAAKELEAA